MSPICPACERGWVEEDSGPHVFLYGEPGVPLVAEFTVFCCCACGLRWSGPDGEDARDRAIAKYLEGK